MELIMQACKRTVTALCLIGFVIFPLALAMVKSRISPSFGLEPAATVAVYLPISLQGPPTPTATPTPSATPIPSDNAANEQQIISLINQQRNANGLAAYVVVYELTQSSRKHSHDMADNNFTSHTGSDGSAPGDRMRAFGYNWIDAGENTGWGFNGDPQTMVNWWMNSPVHRAAILSTVYNDVGAGYALNYSSDWDHYWTVNFGRRAASARPSPATLFTCTFLAPGQLGGGSVFIYTPESCP
jgi:uncharacterized protein YkwD